MMPGDDHEVACPEQSRQAIFFAGIVPIPIYLLSESTMKTISMIAAGLLCAGLSTSALSADLKAGAKTAQNCMMCHGDNGIASMPGTPSLAGQPESYLSSQLRQFRDGKRHNEVMNVIAKPLSDADIDNVAAYFSQFEIDLKRR